MTVRTADAEWKGNLREGSGTLALGSGAFEGAYSFPSRFEEGDGTNPEELIAAAHAGCFSMAFSGDLGRAGYTPDWVRTTAHVHLERVDGLPTISRIDLVMRARVPEISEEEFTKIANSSKSACPVSRALGAVAEITLEATLDD